MLHEGQRTTPTSSGETLTELYRLYAAEAFRFAVHLTGRKEDAEDVLQQVFLQAHRHLESGAELVNPRAWLMIAVKHRVFNLQRARRETPAAEIEPGCAYGPPTDESAELTAVRGILWTLPEKQHQAFVLRYWSGLSQSEIAHVLETTASAVESLLVRARTTLLSERAQGSEECERVRRQLVEGGQLSGPNHDHLRSCSRCRTGQLRLSRVAEFASVVALAPRLHVAQALAAAVPGFSAPAASLSVVGGSAAAGASGATGVSTAAAAATASGKVAMAVKVALAVAATTVAASAVPPIRSAVDRTLFTHHAATAAVAAPHQPLAAAVKAGFAGAGPGLAQAPPWAEGSQGNARGAGSSNGKAVGPGNGNAAGQGNGKAAGPGNGNASGQGNGKAVGPGNGNASGQGNGKAVGPGNGKAKGAANGKANGATNGKANGAAKGAANGKANGKGTTTPKTNGAANGAANAQANGTGAVKGSTKKTT